MKKDKFVQFKVFTLKMESNDEYLHKYEKAFNFILTSSTIFNERLQTSDVTMLVRNILLQLFHKSYQVIHLSD